MKSRYLAKRVWAERSTALRRGVLAGDAAAMGELGLLLQQGIQDKWGRAIVRRNPRVGFGLLLRAADGRDTSSAFELGCAYDLGLGTRKDKRQALRWYRRASRRGYSAASTNIATIYRDDHKLRLAFQWWRRSALSGDGDAAVDVGYCYQYGIGTGRDVHKARLMFRRAMSSRFITAYNSETAMYHLAVALVDDGRARDAVPLLVRASADRDFPEAQRLLKQIRSNSVIRPCRCRRGIRKRLPGHASCPLHPRLKRRAA